MTSAAEKAATRQTSQSVGRRAALVALMIAAVALIGLAQHAVDAASAPFDWPGLGWLDGYFVRAFASPSTLSFALPIFVTGALAFGAAGARFVKADPIVWRAAPVAVPAGYALPLAIGSAALLSIVASLFLGHFDPSFRFIFVSSIGLMVLVLLARDIRDGRLLARPSWVNILELVAVLAVVGTFVGINVRDLSNWRYSSIGDEAGFFRLGNRILQDSQINWFSQRDGVGGIHPVFSSVWHAANMLVFGRDIVGWKMGALTAIAITLPSFYCLLRELFGGRVAIFGAIFLAASHYLFAYAHTGYDNVFPLFPTVAGLACLISGLKRGSPSLLFLAGVLAGLGFYTFHSSRATIMIMAFVLLTTSNRRASFGAAAWLAPAFALTVLPLFATDHWAVISGTTGQSVFGGNGPLLRHIEYNIVRSVFGFSFNPYQLHYTAGALLDGVTLAFAIAGLGLCITRVREFGYRLVLAWFVIATVSTGAFTLHTEVSISRLHYALPPLAACAAVAVDAMVAALVKLDERPIIARALTVGAIAALAPTVFILNGRQFFIYSARHEPTTTVTVVMREVLDPACDKQPLRNIVYMAQPDPSLDPTFEFYGRAESRPIQLAYRDLPFVYSGNPSWGGTGCLIIGDAATSEGQALAQRLTADGAQVQTITDLTGMTQNGLVLPYLPRNGGPATLASVWKTDFGLGSGLEGVFKAQERDFLPTVDSPEAVSVDEAALHVGEPVLAVRAAGSTRGYPIRFLMWHGVVNDVLGGVPIAVTYDPISGSARAFDRRVNGEATTFGLTGFLKDGNALLFDRTTQSWWQQLSGRAVTGVRAGSQLAPVTSELLSGSAFRAIAAGATGQIDVMAAAGPVGQYTHNPYLHYDGANADPIFAAKPVDDRLRPLERVLLIEANGRRIALPYPDETKLRNFSATVTVGGKRLLLFYDVSTVSELDSRRIFNGRRVGSFAVFDAPDGAAFVPAPGDVPFFLDRAGVPWDMLGAAAVRGNPRAPLTPVAHFTAFWFSAASVFPNIEIAKLDRSK